LNHFTPRPPAHRSLASLQRQWESKAKSEYYANVVDITGSLVRRHTSTADPHPTTCQYILGDPTRRDIRKYGTGRFMCSDPTQEHSPYCPDHHAKCYVKKPLTEEEK